MANTVKIQSPKGELEWVTIDGEGKENLSGKLQYVASVVVDGDSPILEKINQFWEDNKPSSFKKKAKSTGVYPHTVATEEKDEDGKPVYVEDGKFILQFKTGTTFPDGSTKKIQIYNAKARKVELPDGVKIGNGTIGAISGAMGIYTNKAKGGNIIDAGVTLYLDAIKISKLVEFTTDAGFEADEDGEEGWSGDEGWAGETEEATEADSGKAKVRL